MCTTIKQIVVILLVALCALSLSFHFVVESVGGIETHFAEGQTHDGDHFVIIEPERKNPAPAGNWFPFRFNLHSVSRPLTPPFQPPKSI